MKISPQIASLVPYKPGKPIAETRRELGIEDIIKLASNENPLGPSPKVVKAVTEALSESHRYPDASCYEAIQALAKYYKVDPEWISIGNGSNEVIDLLIRLYCEPGNSIVTSQAAFVAYKVCAQAARVHVTEVPFDKDLGFDLQAIWAAIEKSNHQNNELVFIANPNNPTGSYLGRSALKEFLDKTKTRPNLMVILDEAYCEYVRATDYPDGIELIRNYPHVATIRTLSKAFGMAGLRVGVLLARPEVIELYNRIRNPFNVNHLAQVATIAALSDREYIDKACRINGEGLDFLYGELTRLGLKFWPSQGNFVLFDTGQDSQLVYEGLLRQGVIVRPVKNYGLHTQLRMSVGLPEENQRAIKALAKVMKDLHS